MKVELIAATPNAEEVIITIARESSEREDKTQDIGKLLKYLTKHKHWSPFEHASITVRITTSRAIAAQFLRHRSFSFQELSQRYAVVGEQEPLELRKQCDDNRQSSSEVCPEEDHKLAEASLKFSHAYYDLLISKGVARESARMVLPMNTQTRLVMTGNIRSWIHFFDVRCDEHAQKEARVIAEEIRDEVFKKVCPITYEMLYPSKGTVSAALEIGDLVVVHDVGRQGDYYSEGDVGVYQGDGLVDFSNQGNPRVQGGGRWYTENYGLTKYDINKL